MGEFSITHWDEGLAWRGAEYFLTMGKEGHYSPTHGPPLLSASLAAWARVFGARPAAAVWLNVLFATGAVPLAYWIVRQIASPRAGLLAAFLIAISGLHVMFARSLLAESAYVFFLLLSLALSLRALTSPGIRWYFAAGLAVAFTQATKYNGCLAAVPLGSVLLLRFLRSPGRSEFAQLAARVGTVALPVVLCMAANLGAIAWMGDLGAFFEHYGGYVGQGTDATTLGGTLEWVMPWGVLAAALLGLVLPTRQGERHALLPIALLLYVVFLFRYAFYLRLLAPVATLLLLLAGLGLDALAQRLPRLAPALLTLALLAIGFQAWSRSERYYLKRFDGYPLASAWLNAQTDRPATLFAGQDFVWGDLDFHAQVVALPSARASELLDQADEIQLVTDIGAFSRLRPWSLEGAFAELMGAHHVRSFEATLNLDALQNNLSLAQLRGLEQDEPLRTRVLKIHVFRLRSSELRALLSPPG